MKQQGTLARGATAGVLAALAVAVWFLIIDTIQGRPLETPAFLASVLFGHKIALAGVAAIAGYTVVHFVAFVLVGIVLAAALRRFAVVPTSLLGIIVGLLLFDIVFYSGVVVTGVNVVKVLGWPEVAVGNLIAGLVLMEWLERTSDVREVTLGELLRGHRTVRQGLVAGVIGSVAVAVWFLIFDMIKGRLFFTPAALGSALFYNARGVQQVQINLTTVGGYTVFHVGAFLFTGLLASALAEQAEQEPRFVLGFALLFVAFETLFFGLLAIAANWLLDALNWGAIAGANLIAALAVGAYLWREHPSLREKLRDHHMDIDSDDRDDVDDEFIGPQVHHSSR
jgi:hypothetical protein